MKFHILGLLLFVPAFGQFQFVNQVTGTIKNAAQTSVHAVENIAKDGIHQVQKLGREIESTVENTFMPNPQPVPFLVPNQVQQGIQTKFQFKTVNVPTTLQLPIPKPETIQKPQNSQASEISKKRPEKRHPDRKPRKQSFSDSQSQSQSQSQRSQDQPQAKNVEVKLCGQGTSNGYGAYIKAVKLFKLQNREQNLIKNSEFKLNNCQGQYCVYNKNTYKNQVDSWQSDPQLQIGYGYLYTDKLHNQRVFQLDANQNTCVKQIIPSLDSGKYKLEVSYGARQRTSLTDDNRFNIQFNGKLLKSVISTDYELHTEILKVSIGQQKREKGHHDQRRKKRHGHQKFNPEMKQIEMKKCQQKLEKIVEQFKKIQQQHKKQGKKLNEQLIRQNQQQIKRLNHKMQRIMKKQHNNQQKPQRVRIQRQINVKVEDNIQRTIVHERIQIQNPKAEQQNFRRDRKGHQNQQRQFNKNEDNKQMQKLMKQKRNPFEHQGELKRNIQINQIKVEKAHKIINEQNVMSGKRHIREQMMQTQKINNADIKDLNEQKQADNNNVEFIILN